MWSAIHWCNALLPPTKNTAESKSPAMPKRNLEREPFHQESATDAAVERPLPASARAGIVRSIAGSHAIQSRHLHRSYPNDGSLERNSSAAQREHRRDHIRLL